MSSMASQITSLTIVYSTVYSRRRSNKHQNSASLALVRGIHWWPVNSPHKWPETQKMFPFEDVIIHTAKLLRINLTGHISVERIIRIIQISHYLLVNFNYGIFLIFMCTLTTNFPQCLRLSCFDVVRYWLIIPIFDRILSKGLSYGDLEEYGWINPIILIMKPRKSIYLRLTGAYIRMHSTIHHLFGKSISCSPISISYLKRKDQYIYLMKDL